MLDSDWYLDYYQKEEEIMLEDLERCEECGHYVLSRELTEVDTTLWCKDCIHDIVVSERAMRMANR